MTRRSCRPRSLPPTTRSEGSAESCDTGCCSGSAPGGFPAPFQGWKRVGGRYPGFRLMAAPRATIQRRFAAKQELGLEKGSVQAPSPFRPVGATIQGRFAAEQELGLEKDSVQAPSPFGPLWASIQRSFAAARGGARVRFRRELGECGTRAEHGSARHGRALRQRTTAGDPRARAAPRSRPGHRSKHAGCPRADEG